ncbi:hypothetical protein D3C76_1226790 [compost metagenome]
MLLGCLLRGDEHLVVREQGCDLFRLMTAKYLDYAIVREGIDRRFAKPFERRMMTSSPLASLGDFSIYSSEHQFLRELQERLSEDNFDSQGA